MSNPLLDLVAANLDSATIGRMAREIGASPEATGQAAAAAVPALLGALNRQAASPGGAASLLSALDRDHDGSLLDDLGSLLGGLQGGGKATDGAGILGHILGSKRGPVEQQIAESSGLSSASIGRLLEMIAPIIMAALAKTKTRSATTAGNGGGLFDILGGAAARTQKEGGLGGMLGSLLDSDGDGDISDDIARMGAGVLGGLFGRK